MQILNKDSYNFALLKNLPIFQKNGVYLILVARFTLTNQMQADALKQISAFQHLLVL